jgi:very-short-patch-repair endonuclease
MSHASVVAQLSMLSRDSLGVFRGRDAVALGVSRNQLTALLGAGVIAREHPDTYRLVAIARSREQRLHAALAWAGPDSGAAGQSAGEMYKFEGVRAPKPEIIVPRHARLRSDRIVVHRTDDATALMFRTLRGMRVTGTEATLVALGALLEPDRFEIACEDARRRKLTSVPALRTYLDRFPGRTGAVALRALLAELDPVHPSRSTLEVKTRRLLVANGFTDFVREFPLEWNGRTYSFDFCFDRRRTILETNGKRWHDDPTDYENDNEKWSVPGRHGYRLVFATWKKVTERPQDLLTEIAAALAA